MHEASIAQSIVDIIREEMLKGNATTLKWVRLHVGRMSGVVPDSLSFCFKWITQGTEMENAELLMDIVPLKGFCEACHTSFEIEHFTSNCPLCGGERINMVSGRELSIVEIEVM